MKKLLLLFLLMAYLPASADHITGGELYYTLMSSQGGMYQYKVTVKMFMRCNSGRQFNNPAIVSIFEKGSNTRVRDHEVSLSRSETLQLADPNKCITDPPIVCYEVGYYEFTTSLPPSPNGYVVASQFVFRIAGIRNLEPFYSSVGTTYMGEIPANTNASAAANNSAQFIGSDLVAVCANNRFAYSFAAADPDGDQLRYRFCDAYQGGSFRMGAPMPPAPPPYMSVPYGNGFSGVNPLGDKVSIDSRTGLITGIAPDEGIYVVTVCVEEIRNGQVIATQRKDLQIYIASCTIAAAALQPAYDLCDSTQTIAVSNMSTSPLIQTYNWEVLDRNDRPLGNASQANFNYTFSDTGLYRLRLVINRNGACADSSDALVRVYPGFKPAFTFEGLCAGKPVRFRDATSTTYGRVVQWNWDFGPGGIPDLAAGAPPGPQISCTYAQQGGREVRMQVTNSNGCTATATRMLDVVDRPALTLPFRDTLICINDALQLRASGEGQIRWSPQVAMRDANSASPTVSPGTTTRYFAELNDNGCINRDSVLVQVASGVRLEAMADTTICAGDSVQLRLSGNALRYSWVADNNLAVASVRQPLVAVPASATYSVTGQIGNCVATTSIRVNAVPYPVSNAGMDTSICFGTTALLSARIEGSRFTWSQAQTLDAPGSLQTTARPVGTTAYILTVTDTRGCPKPGIDTVVVRVLPPVIASAGRDTTVVVGQPLQLQATGGSRYQWQPATLLSVTNQPNPVALFPPEYIGEIRYRVQVFTPEGCTDTASVRVKVFGTAPTVFVPSAFSPNGDGRNDLLRPIAAGIQRVDQFSVFNRWGQLLYNDRNGRGWDGRVTGQLQATGVYVWMVRAVDFRGQSFVQKGTVTLLR